MVQVITGPVMPKESECVVQKEKRLLQRIEDGRKKIGPHGGKGR
jgi:hypothetical protein